MAHTHSQKKVIVSYAGGTTLELWSLRFNRGTKKNKPVKFFASVEWKSGAGGVAYAGTHWDFPSEAEAEAWFAAGVAERGGEVTAATTQALKKLEGLGFGAT